MATSDNLATGDAAASVVHATWNVEDPMVQVDRSGDPTPSVQVRHPHYPYEAIWTMPHLDLAGLIPIAHQYLVAVHAKLGLHPRHLSELAPPGYPTRPGFGLAWMLEPGNTMHSQWLTRSTTAGLADRTALLLAAMSLKSPPANPMSVYFNGGQGIRIAARVSELRHNRYAVRFTGVVSTVPELPVTYLRNDPTRRSLDRQLRSLAQAAASTLPESVTLVDHGVMFLTDRTKTPTGTVVHRMRAHTTVPPAGQRLAVAARESSQLTVTSHQVTMGWQIQGIRLQPLVAFATAPAFASIMASDPVSRQGGDAFRQLRPHQSDQVFNPFRTKEPLGKLPSTTPGWVELDNGEVRVRHVRLVDVPAKTEDTPYQVSDNSDADVRSNEFAAVNAFFHVASMFDRMRRYGLDNAEFFRFASLPLDVHYRAGIVPGMGDGRTVNAQVRWTIEAPPSTAPARKAPAGALSSWSVPAANRRLELRFALGDLHRAAGRLPANLRSAAARSPLGLCVDARWCWHEFAHVLCAAATGELELPFAHSVGDALAAIASDPASALARKPDGSASNDGAWRFVTFPWVFIPRRHDRDVQRGWSWTETVCGAAPPHGYRSEQLMSTTLFRLYRALGGDCLERDASGRMVPAVSARENAAHYAIYLIMRTLSFLGPANATPCTSVHHFVHAMRTVDLCTSGQPGPGGYIGGTANKLIQWAFERQGLYGTPVPGSRVIGPEGSGNGPPEVDLHIDDMRKQTDGPYTPIDLQGSAWHASPSAIEVRRVNAHAFSPQTIGVTVHNRGADAAPGTTVSVWCAPLGSMGEIPHFPGLEWMHVGNTVNAVPGHNGTTPGVRRFRAIRWSPPHEGRYAVLASATCAADRSNIDPVTAFPCASEPGPIDRLVAFDNNLALSVVTV